MKPRYALAHGFPMLLLLLVSPLGAQDLGPAFRKIDEGIFVYAAKPEDSNCGIILTQDGVVLIDSGHRPPDSLAVFKAVRNLSTQPVRFLINTEPHADHTTGHFVFSPPAVIVAHAGASDSMRKAYRPQAGEKLMQDYPDAGTALKDFRLVTPHVEYRDRMSLAVGERKFELMYLKNAHSESDTAIWLPKERVLFAAATVFARRFPNHRPFVSIPDIQASLKAMKALEPEVVVPGHGTPGTVQLIIDTQRYYDRLLERVGALARAGRTLDQVKKELRMPEYGDWDGKDRFPNNIEAAWRALNL